MSKQHPLLSSPTRTHNRRLKITSPSCRSLYRLHLRTASGPVDRHQPSPTTTTDETPDPHSARCLAATPFALGKKNVHAWPRDDHHACSPCTHACMQLFSSLSRPANGLASRVDHPLISSPLSIQRRGSKSDACMHRLRGLVDAVGMAFTQHAYQLLSYFIFPIGFVDGVWFHQALFSSR